VARADLLQTNFSAGELSPRLYGRVDLAKYNDSVKLARDVVLLQHGGARGRPGTVFVGEVKDSAAPTRIIPFVFSQTDAYLVEGGDGYFRFWKNGALLGLPYEIGTPYSGFAIFEADFAQGADSMFLVRQNITPRRLRRFGDTRWTLDEVPFAPAPFDEVGHSQATEITLGALTGATTATAAAAAFLASDVGRTITHAGGIALITGYTSTTVVDVTVTSDFESVTLPASEWVLTGSPQTSCTPTDEEPVGLVTQLTLAAAGWRATDVGKYVQLNGGMLRITNFVSTTVVDARIESVLSATVAAEANAWTIEGSVWNAIDGYPRTVSLHQQRLVLAGSPKYPQTVWGSRSGLYFDFTKGVLDDDSYSFTLGSDEINPIEHLSSNRDLMALTFGGEWTITGGIEKPITPTNVRAQPQAKAGAANVRPEQVDDDLYYVQRGVSALRTLGFAIELGGYQSGEASTLFEHLARGGVEAISYAQSPERVLWVLKDDGTLLPVTISREQNVRAGALCTIAGGVVESIATIPEDGEDRTYLVVRRTIDGATKRYVERLDWNTYCDSAITADLAPAAATVTGLDHLEGLSVVAVADGIDVGDFMVSGGEIELPRTASQVVVGLRYTPTLRLLAPEFGTGMGASFGRRVHNGSTKVLFSDTIGCTVNGDPLEFRAFGTGILNQPVEPFSGFKEISDRSWDRDAGEIELAQPQAYPWCVLAVVRRMTANPG
jgi:hypothetical protein